MASSLFVPFTLHVQPSKLCESLHEEFAPLLSLLHDEEKFPAQVESASERPKTTPNALTQLLASVDISLPSVEPQSNGDLASDFVAEARRSAKFEKNYVRLVFQEYCGRKSVEKEWETSVSECGQWHHEVLRLELSPETRALLSAFESGESETRASLLAAYDLFVEWVDAETPRWVEAARSLEARRRANEAAIEAAKRALADELAQQQEDVRVGGEMSAHTDHALRRRAIAMIEQEQARRLRAEEAELDTLRLQEEHLRRGIEERRRRREAEEARGREAGAESLHRALIDQENSLRQRLSQREEERARREEERRLLLEHIEAEEQLLRRRLAESEAMKKRAEEEKNRLEREGRDELYEHLEAEEALLRQRLQRYEEARLAETEAAKRREDEEREVLYEHVRAEEEILRQRVEQRKKEKMAAKAKREQEEQERQKDALIKALEVETSLLEERMRQREARNQRLLQLEEEKRAEQLRLLRELEAKQQQRSQAHVQQQPPPQHASSVARYHSDPMALNTQPVSNVAGVWRNPSAPHHSLSYPHFYLHPEQQLPPNYLPQQTQR